MPAFRSHNFPNTESNDSWHPFSSEGIEILNVIFLLFSIPRAVVERSSAKHKIPAYSDRDGRASSTAFFTAANKEHTLLMGCSTLPTKFSLVFSLKKFFFEENNFVPGHCDGNVLALLRHHCHENKWLLFLPYQLQAANDGWFPTVIYHFPTFMQNPIDTWEIDEWNFVGGFLKQIKTSTIYHNKQFSCF